MKSLELNFSSNLGYRLSYMRLINIQSYTDVEFNFSEGLNHIKAKSETGKSILRKSLELLFSGTNSRDIIEGMISDNAQDACIIIGNFNGSYYGRCISLVNQSYYFTYDSEGNIINIGNDVEQVRNAFKIIYDSETEKFLNIQNIEEMMFYNYSDKSNANLMKLGLESNTFDDALVYTKQRVDKVYDLYNRLSNYQKQLMFMKSNMQVEDVNLLKQQQFNIRKTIKELESLANIKTNIVNLRNNLVQLSATPEPLKIELIQSDLNNLKQLDYLKQQIIQLNNVIQSVSNIDIQYLDKDNIDKDLQTLNNIEQIKQYINNAYNTTSNLNQQNIEFENLKIEIENIKSEIGFCPLCNSKIGG